MKQKLFTLLTLLLVVCSSAWADEATVTLSGTTSKGTKSDVLTPSIASSSASITTGACSSTCANSGYHITSYDGKYFVYSGTNYYIGHTYTTGSSPSKTAWTNAGATNQYGTFTVPEGYKYTITKVSHAMGCQSADFTAAIIVKDGTSTKYTSGNIALTAASDKSTLTLTNIVLEGGNQVTLLAGTYTLNVNISTTNASTGKYCGIAQVILTGNFEADSEAENAPEEPTFSVDGGAVNGGSTTTIESTYATKIYYAWTASSTAPAKGDVAYSEAGGDSYVYTIPNTTATMYLHSYGWNNHDGSSSSTIKTAQFNVSKVYSPAKTWDFTSTPADVLEALGNTSNWDYESASQRYKNHSAVTADSELGTLTASSWSGIQVGGSISAGNLRINKDAYIQINGGGYYYTITDLLDGDVVKVRCYSANQTSDRSLTITGGDVASASAPQSNNGFAETTITKDGDGDLILTNTGGGINIMSIALNEDLPDAPTVTISTASGKTYATYVTSYALDFSTVSDDIKAYVAASEASEGKVTFKGKDAVPAGTPLLIKTTSAGATINVPVASSAPAAVGTNKLVAGDGNNITYDASAGHYYYILSNGVFRPANASPVAVGKAYLALDAAASAQELTISFDDEEGDVTGIAEIKKMRDGENETFFDLSGRRVAQPTKGLYIVNGRKVIIK